MVFCWQLLVVAYMYVLSFVEDALKKRGKGKSTRSPFNFLKRKSHDKSLLPPQGKLFGRTVNELVVEGKLKKPLMVRLCFFVIWKYWKTSFWFCFYLFCFGFFQTTPCENKRSFFKCLFMFFVVYTFIGLATLHTFWIQMGRKSTMWSCSKKQLTVS